MIQELLSSPQTFLSTITEREDYEKPTWEEFIDVVISHAETPEHYELIFEFFTPSLMEAIRVNGFKVLADLERLDDANFMASIKTKLSEIEEEYSIDLSGLDDEEIYENAKHIFVTIDQNDVMELIELLFYNDHQESVKNLYFTTQNCLSELKERYDLSPESSIDMILELFFAGYLVALAM